MTQGESKMANVSPLLSNNSDMLFSPEQLRPAASEKQLYQENYGRYSQPASPDSNAVAQGLLPNFIVDSGQGSAGDKNITGNTDSIDERAAARNSDGIGIDIVFKKPITNDPAIIGSAAKAIVRDVERMLLYLALMKFDSEQLSKVTDTSTVSALQTAIDTELTNSQLRIARRFTEMGMDKETEQGILELFTTLRNGFTNGGARQTDQTVPGS